MNPNEGPEGPPRDGEWAWSLDEEDEGLPQHDHEMATRWDLEEDTE